MAVATIGALGTATANAAPASSGGGCNSDVYVEACISASGSHLESDFYTLQNNSRCKVVSILVIDAATGDIVKQFDGVTGGCALGHHGPFGLDSTDPGIVNGHSYYSEAVYNFTDGGPSARVPSPHEIFSY